jgi:hypothetical protein
VTPQNNAAVLIVQALGRQALPANQPRDGITARLGMAPVPDQGEYFQTYEAYCKAHSMAPDPDPTHTHSPATQPAPVNDLTRQWIKENEKPLALITEASKRDRFFMPFNGGTRPTTLIEILLPYLGELRDAKRALLTRSWMRLEAGDFHGFHEDITTVHRLARLLASAATMVDRLVAVELQTSASRTERLAASGGELSREQMKALLDDLAKMPELPPFDDAVNCGERFMVLDILQSAARVGPSQPLLLDVTAGINRKPGEPFIWRLAYRFWPVPYEEAMRVMNHFYDGGLAAAQLATYPERREALTLWDQQVIQIQKRSFIPKMLSAEWPTQVFLPSLLGMVWHADKARVERRLTDVALALAMFKAEHGAYPAALDELSPAYLASVPNDVFSEKPLIYARHADGYALYSVGPNMTDDGGKDQRPGDDIVASVP